MSNLCSSSEVAEDVISVQQQPQHAFLALPRVMGPLRSPASEYARSSNPRANSPVNPYHILQIRTDATAYEITESYKRLALLYHPGRKQYRNSSESGNSYNRTITKVKREEELVTKYYVFELLAACYETLIHPDSRRRYDTIRRDLEQSKFQAGVRGAMFVGGKPIGAKSLATTTSATTNTTTNITDTSSNVNSAFSTPTRRRNSWISSLGGTPASVVEEGDGIPCLSRASTESFDSNDEHHTSTAAGSVSQASLASSMYSPSRQGRRITAARVKSPGGRIPSPVCLADQVGSSSGEDDDEAEEAETHFTQHTTQLLFGGPRSHLYKACNFEPFRDSHEVFEEVFGSQIFPRVPKPSTNSQERWTPPNSPPRGDGNHTATSNAHPSSSSSTTNTNTTITTFTTGVVECSGSTVTSNEGRTVVYTTSRLLDDRRLTRTETVTTLASGRKKTHVSVTSEFLGNRDGVDENDIPGSITCLICGDSKPAESKRYNCNSSIDGDEDLLRVTSDKDTTSTVCGDFWDLCQVVTEELELGRNDMYEQWMNVFSQAGAYVHLDLSSPQVNPVH